MVCAPASSRGVRRRVDWRRATQLLAQGKSPSEVAQTLGCSASTISRRLARDHHLAATIARAAEAHDPEEERLRALRQTLHRAIETEVQGGNVRVILWLADRLKLIRPPDQRTPQDELDDLIGTMSPDELKEFEALTDAP